MLIYLVVSTQLKNISQNGNLPQVGMKMKNIWVATTQYSSGVYYIDQIPSSFCERFLASSPAIGTSAVARLQIRVDKFDAVWNP